MISVIINVIVLFCAITWFEKKETRHRSLVALYFFVTNWCMSSRLILGDANAHPIKPFDFIFLFGIYIVMTKTSKEKWLKNDKFGRFLFLFLFLHILQFIRTVVMGYETFGYAFQDARQIFLYAMYFPLKEFEKEDFPKAFKIIIWIEVALGVNFVLQYAGIYILGDPSDIQYDHGMVRYRNIPAWFLFFLIFMIISGEKIQHSKIVLLLFVSMLILPMSRMRIVLVCGVLAYYFLYMQKNIGRIMKICIFSILIGFVLSPYLLSRFQSSYEEVSFTEDIQFAFSTSDYTAYNRDDGGTFAFRLAMLEERFDYLVRHPEYLITGVGFIHELSPKCYTRFNFMLATRVDSYEHGRDQIHSSDINWVRILMQFGLVGVVLYIVFMFVVCKQLYINRQDVYCCAAYLYFLIYSIGSISEAVWTQNRCFMFLLSMIMCYCSKVEDYKSISYKKLIKK